MRNDRITNGYTSKISTDENLQRRPFIHKLRAPAIAFGGSTTSTMASPSVGGFPAAQPKDPLSGRSIVSMILSPSPVGDKKACEAEKESSVWFLVTALIFAGPP